MLAVDKVFNNGFFFDDLSWVYMVPCSKVSERLSHGEVENYSFAIHFIRRVDPEVPGRCFWDRRNKTGMMISNICIIVSLVNGEV